MNLHKQDPQPSDLEYRTLTLSQGQFAIVDVSDYDWLSKWKWTAVWDKNAKTFYAARTYQLEDGRYKHVRMHRIIMDAPRGILVDHADHNTLNNRRYNLRFATYSQNNANARHRNKTGFKGITFRAKKNRWRAIIKKDKKSIELGLFKTAEEAHAAYCVAAKELHGDFACVNVSPSNKVQGS